MKKNKHSLKISRSYFGETTLDGRVVYFTNKKGVAKAFHDEYDPATKTTRTKVVETLCNEE